MKNKFVMLILINFSQLQGWAQKQGQERIDSLLKALPQSIDDTNKVNLLNDLCFTYYAINPDKGLSFGNLALVLSEKLKWKKGVAAANSRIGSNFFGKGDYPNALKYWLKSLKQNEEINNKKSVAINLGNIGNVYLQQGTFDKALEYYLKASKANKDIGNNSGLAINMGNIGTVYGIQLKYDKSIGYFIDALKIYEELQDKSGIARTSLSLGNVYYGLSQYDKALEYNFKALAIVKEFGVNNLIATGYVNIGKIYLSLSNDSNKSQLNSLMNGNKKATLDKAKAYIDSAIVEFKKIGDISALYQTYESLSNVQSNMGDKTGALESYKKFVIYKDSVFNLEKDKKLTQTAMQYEFDKKEALTKAKSEKELQKQKLMRNGFIVGTILFLMLALAIFIGLKKTSKAKKKSEELLLNILPAEVADELKKTGEAKAKSFTMVTVMFTDFKGFTNVSEKVSAELLVAEIHYCFSAFDKIIQKYKIEKIKTIGDAYLCASGLPVSNYSHAKDMVSAAIEIKDFILQRKKEKELKGELPFEIRIGLHTGPVVAGIVGIKKYAYDIWGDTVNIAARMEQNSETGKINISGSTYELVKENFNCLHRGKIDAKNKGMIDMYFVES
ncbi:MAG TPA: adenylate/guanylate cyclase domain-containing protein [Bacteroidia bacterium]|nr:adenylate/guanylate cyclase domain-containing protein [Bacteroidia bacterium]